MKKNLLCLLAALCFALSGAMAQSKKITGKVVGADDGQPLPGVTVKVKGTQTGVQTVGDGSFSIPANHGQVLVFSYVGFFDQSVTIAADYVGTIKLATNTKMLSEVVIKDAYGVQAQKAYTGSAAVVSGADIENKPYSSPLQALQGQLPGVAITANSGQPGANVQVRIRGLNGLTAANPLYVVDGMFITSGDVSRQASTSNVLSGINDNDIESITVLKDAAATAIYGSRGTNGVIVITTKKGKAGKTQVRFDTEVGRTNNLALPEAGKPLSGADYRMLTVEGLNNAGYSASTIANVISSYGLDGRSNNWYDIITNPGKQQQYNVSLNGGDEKTRMFTSAGYYTQEATVLKTNLRRINGLLNIDHTINNKFSISTGLNISNVIQNTPLSGSAYYSSPLASAYFLRPFQLAYNDDGTPNSSITGNTNFPSSGSSNPVYVQAHDKRNLSESRILGNGAIKWNIWDQLKFTSYVSIDFLNLEETTFLNPNMGDGLSLQGSGTSTYTRYFNWLTRNQFDYRYNFKNVSDFYVEASVGYEAQRSTNYYNTAYSTKYPASQPLLTAVAVAATPTTASEATSNFTFDAIYARATINFKNRYIINGSFRRDGSSRFGTTHQYGNFPAIGGAWNIDQEDFFNQQKLLSTAKFRVSYGTTGNANSLSNYQWRPTAGYGLNYNLANGQNYNTVGNPDLAWETAHKMDAGFDIGFFNDRLAFSVDAYRNKIDGLILNVQLSRTTGFSTVATNVGAMQTQGLEFAIKGQPVKLKDFTWRTNFNIAYNENKMVSIVTTPGVNGSYYLAPGVDYYAYYARPYAGVDPATGAALWYVDNTHTTTTTNINNSARELGGQADPKLIGGFSNSFSYKNFTLTGDFYFSFGNRISDSWSVYLNDSYDFFENKYSYTLNRWTTPGQITDVPKYVYGSSSQSSSFSSRFLYYGDFIRLKNLSLGYDFKSLGFLKKYGISRLNLYGRATNLWTKTYDKRLPFDPEVPVSGFSTLDVPQVRTFTVGLNVGF